MLSPVVYKPVLGYVKAEIIVNCVFVLITLAVVALRVVGRVNGPGLGWDDGMVLLATVRSLSDIYICVCAAPDRQC